MKYRKRPVVVEAYQTDKEVVIHTLEGDMKASIGDYIITGVNGEQYPCKPDIFEKTYEVASDNEETNVQTVSWIPIVKREPTQDEKDIYLANYDVDLYFVVESELPSDGQEVLVSIDGISTGDVFIKDCCNFENNDIKNIDAWMPMPKAYNPEKRNAE